VNVRVCVCRHWLGGITTAAFLFDDDDDDDELLLLPCVCVCVLCSGGTNTRLNSNWLPWVSPVTAEMTSGWMAVAYQLVSASASCGDMWGGERVCVCVRARVCVCVCEQ
jgi:hypothetical protein